MTTKPDQQGPKLSPEQLDLEISRLQSAMAARQQTGRPMNHCVLTAYKTQIARFQSAQSKKHNPQ